MNTKFATQGHRAGIVALLLLTFTLAMSLGSQSGYAEAPLQQIQPEHATEPEGSKPDVPSVCGPLGFSNNAYGAGSAPVDVAIGDFNGDGTSDLATANYDSNNISVLLGNGNGTFLNATYYSAGINPISVSVADLFGDQNEDLVVARLYSSQVSYLQGNGDGTFFPPYQFDMGLQILDAVVGDVNNDTYPDLVAVSGSYGKVLARLNDGLGDFAPPTNIDVSGYPTAMEIGDLNSDGKLDVVTANRVSDSVAVLLGNGNGTFQTPINFMVGDHPISVAIGDFNGDGKPDLAVANLNSDNISVLLGNGDGLFQTAVNFDTGDGSNGAAVGDFNDDAIPDLATANFVSNSVSVLLGNGDGSFQAVRNFNAGSGAEALTVGDFNRDGKPDLATANDLSDSVSVLLNTCVSLSNTPTPTSVPTNTPLATQTPGGATATPQACAIQFTDVPPDNTFYPFVRCLACRNIISGYNCGGSGEPCNSSNDPYFRPSNPLTRGQLAKIVSNSAGFSDPVSGQTFEDIPPGSTFYTFVGRLVSRDVMGGYSCGGTGEPCGPASLPYFRSGSGATRGQLTKIVSNSAGFTNPAPNTFTFTDVPVGSTFHMYVERLLMNRPGVMGGYACGGAGEPCDSQNRAYFRPTNPLSRGQTSKIVGNTFYPNCQTLDAAGN